MKSMISNFGGIFHSDKLTADQSKKIVEYTNLVGSETSRLIGEYPVIRNLLKGDEVGGIANRGVFRYLHLNDKEMGALWDNDKIPMGTRACFRKEYDAIYFKIANAGIGKTGQDSLTIGKFNASPDARGTFRHELGHGLYSARVGLEKESGGVHNWVRIWRTVGEQGFAKKVSGYSKTNSEEAFCESFSAYTNKGYGKVGTKRLPAEVETYFRGILGRG